MKKLTSIATAIVAALLTACATTTSTILEYDTAGNVVKKTETTQSVISEITESTKDKTVIGWESGWAAYISASTATTQDPTPTVKMFAGKTDKGAISALPDQQNWDGIAEVINATKYELTVSADGVGATSASKTKTAAEQTADESATAEVAEETSEVVESAEEQTASETEAATTGQTPEAAQ